MTLCSNQDIPKKKRKRSEQTTSLCFKQNRLCMKVKKKKKVVHCSLPVVLEFRNLGHKRRWKKCLETTCVHRRREDSMSIESPNHLNFIFFFGQTWKTNM